MKIGKLLYYFALSTVVLAIGFIFAAVFTDGLTSDIFYGVSSFLGIVSFALLIVKLNYDANNFKGDINENNGPKVVVKVVDVKEIKKTNEQKLYEQYEELYKQNLITKEDLENKKKELLG